MCFSCYVCCVCAGYFYHMVSVEGMPGGVLGVQRVRGQGRGGGDVCADLFSARKRFQQEFVFINMMSYDIYDEYVLLRGLVRFV